MPNFPPIPEPSALSKNYSGSSGYYTPNYMVNYLISAIDYFLVNEFDMTKGIADLGLNFLDPAAGDLIFPLGLFRYVSNHIEKNNLEEWISSVFDQKTIGFEIDPQVCTEATEKLQKTTRRTIRYYCGNPLLGPVKNPNLIKYDQTKNTKNDQEIISALLNDFPNKSEPLIIFGNPPYSISSKSTGNWMKSLIEDYKRDLNRKGRKRIVGLKGIQDDYVKFLRLAQWKLSDKNTPGIIAFVVNNYFLDGDVFRGMRSSLRQNFDKIWVLNLHGDPKKSPNIDGGRDVKDENIFEIQTGICLFIALKKRRESPADSQIFYHEIVGSRKLKQEFLNIPFSPFNYSHVKLRQDFEFIPISDSERALEQEYNRFWYLPEIFSKHIIGIQSLHDTLVTHPDKASLEQIIGDFYSGKHNQKIILDSKNQKWVKIPGLVYHDARDWKINFGLKGSYSKARKNFFRWNWRGFDRWWVAYDEHLMTKGSSSYSLMQFLLPPNNNMAIGCSRVSRKASGETSILVVNGLAESHFIESGSGIGDYLFPLYRDSEAPKIGVWEHPRLASNLNFSSDFQLFIRKYNISGEEAFYYIYALLWTPNYRRQYANFLKRDFPKICFPPLSIKNLASNLQKFISLGVRLVSIHLEPASLISGEKKAQLIRSFTFGPKNDLHIRKFRYSSEECRIYFDTIKSPSDGSNVFWIGNISNRMWEFEIGGIQQIKLWLTHRRYSPPEKSKRYKFARSITKEEQLEFLQICEAARKTLDILPELEKLYLILFKSLNQSNKTNYKNNITK